MLWEVRIGDWIAIHSEQNKVFLFKIYWSDAIDRGIRVDLYHGLVEINTKTRIHDVDNVFVLVKQCQQVYITYIISFRNNRSRVDWLSIVKTIPGSHIQVV